MTALAFLFAVFLARPCPFYILDEVEAALDDLNLDRFLALLRRYAGRAQFIVITHQKRTMEAADWLFGVSMGGDGVSKVLSRRLPADAAAEDAGEAETGPQGSPRSPERQSRPPSPGAAPAAVSSRRRGARLERAVHHGRRRRGGAPSRPPRNARGLFAPPAREHGQDAPGARLGDPGDACSGRSTTRPGNGSRRR